MNRFAVSCLVILLCQSAGSALAADKAFESNYAKARKNAATPAGAAYDIKLGRMMQTNPEFAKRFQVCANRYPGKQSAHGYFSFSSASSYKVVLKPGSAFAGCLAHALEGHRVPPPPSLPYVNPFDLNASPSGK